ncbi:hypothetical protein FIBSPDRAFT_1049095 [Athelia psychrophila]|uniref:F-box domain-containing protein n=1 Tax=Athelia psychrophila TaxID=1759441 RepID=A0A166CRE7_9AGAM|nr:hypothetical protein FIBSPDRAFT_1049095 [Fibularhizoctonia sp. CBS 109695]
MIGPIYCLISGCTPQIHPERSQWEESVYEPVRCEDKHVPGPLVEEAIKTLVDDEDEEWMDNVTVIGLADNRGKLIGHQDKSLRAEKKGFDVGRLRDAPILSDHCYVDRDSWEYGDILSKTKRKPTVYHVSQGVCFMVLTRTLAIMRRATDGQLTPQRLWRLAMILGRDTGFSGTGIKDIDYGFNVGQAYYPWTLPGLYHNDMCKLESLGDLELVKEAMMLQGGYWVWTAPDRFPLGAPGQHARRPKDEAEPSNAPNPAKFEMLPIEALTHIMTLVSLADIVSVASASKRLQHKILGVHSNTNTIAREWINANAPWYKPYQRDEEETHQSDDDGDSIVSDDLEEDDDDDNEDGAIPIADWWQYLKRCLQSGSMKNRKRIWAVCERLEQKADEFGV